MGDLSVQRVISEYLRDDGGASLPLSSEQAAKIRSLAKTSDLESSYADVLASLESTNNSTLSDQITAQNATIAAHISETSETINRNIAAVGSAVAEGFAVTLAKLDQIDNNVRAMNRHVDIVNSNVIMVASALAELSQSFHEYVDEDRKTQAIQQATSDLTNVRLELERRFGSHAKIRANAAGLLRATDLGIVRTNTIITETEKNLLNAPSYWLAPALIALAYWIDGATGKNPTVSQNNAMKALNEAYRLDRQKTALLFGLVNLRANKREEAANWFAEYLSFQRPEKVDHTMTMLLNICSSGVLIGTKANNLVVGRLSTWIDLVDQSATDRAEIVEYWKKASLLDSAQASLNLNRFSAITACCPTVAEDMKCALSGAYLHGITRTKLETKLAQRDLVEEETWAQIDEMVLNLAGNFAGEELPLRRDFAYNQLVIDLKGNTKLAQGLRAMKKEILSETKRFIDIMNHAAYDSAASGASAATSAMAVRLEMPWIKEGYQAAANSLIAKKPAVIPIKLADFTTQTVDGSDEQRIVQDYSAHIDGNMRRCMAEAAAKPLHMGLAIGGGVLLLLSIIMFISGSFGGLMLAILSIAAGAFGISKILKARKEQESIMKNLEVTRKQGILALREVCNQIREWMRDFDSHQAEQPATETYMNQIIQDSIEAAALASSRR